jgi:protein Tex
MDVIVARLASELAVRVEQVTAAVGLLDEGATVPFIARYRKERTGGLDDTQLRRLTERLTYLRDLEDRRASILKTVSEQGKLTAELERALRHAQDKVTLEDLYAPYKQKRRTKAMIAREQGLEPLLDQLLLDPTRDPDEAAQPFVAADKGVADIKAALDGARAILVERIGERADLVGSLRTWLWNDGVVTSVVAKGKDVEGAKFSDYFDFKQKIKDLPSHRALALLRGRNEGILELGLDVPFPDGQR